MNPKQYIQDQRWIDYKFSPNGKAFIGVAKSPLQKNKEGFGYLGVLIQNENRDRVQCHVCGNWFPMLTNTHIALHDFKNKLEYCRKFGLRLANKLTSDQLSQRLAINGRKNITNYYNNLLSPEARIKVNTENQLIAGKMAKEFSNTIESQNSHNTCEQQIGFRIVEYVKKYYDLPKPSDKGEGRSITKVLTKRYGNANLGFKHYELPVRERVGSSVVLKAPNGKTYKYNYNSPAYNQSLIYQWMYEQCPMLHPEAINKFNEEK